MLFQKGFNQYVNDDQEKERHRHSPTGIAAFFWNLHHLFDGFRPNDGVGGSLHHGVVHRPFPPAGTPTDFAHRVAFFVDVDAVVDEHRVSHPHILRRDAIPGHVFQHRTHRPTASATRQAQDNRHYEGSC